MVEVPEAIAPAHSASPRLDLGSVEFDSLPATTTDQMVMMRNQITPSIEGLAAVTTDAVDLSGIGKGPELAVDRRQPHLLPRLLETGVKILGTAELPRLRQ